MSQSAGGIQTPKFTFWFYLSYFVRRKELKVLARIFCIILLKYALLYLVQYTKLAPCFLYSIQVLIIMVHSFCE